MLIGLLSDPCIDHTIKDAADRSYRALACFQGYAGLLEQLLDG